MMNHSQTTLISMFLFYGTVAGATPSFVVAPSGQATGSTCQSYALVVGLAFKRAPDYSIQSASDLRKAELALRAEIKKAAGTAEVSHDHIKNGFDKYTGGKFKLNFKDVALADLGSLVGARTGITNAASAPPTFALGTVVKDVVLASATRIGSDTYGSGHIFTLLGVDGAPNSNQQFLTLNSAVKVKNDAVSLCENGVPDDPGPYTALLSWKKSSQIDFKQWGGKVRLWLIEP
jgi:hypothetical protein